MTTALVFSLEAAIRCGHRVGGDRFTTIGECVRRKQADGTVTVAVTTEGEIAFDPPGISVAVASLLG